MINRNKVKKNGIELALSYENLSIEDKAILIKDRLHLSHGTGKRKKKKRK